MDSSKEFNVVAFCAGYGGIERGLEIAGIKNRVVAYVEIEAYAIRNLVDKMETGELAPAPIFTDVKQFPAKHFRGKVDIVTGGYPCQPFSSAGQRKGKDDPRHLWPFLLKHVKAINPVRCFWENVYGHVRLGLRKVLSDMESENFKTEFGVFSAAEAGAVHERKRVFIMADSNYAHSERGGVSSRVHAEQSHDNSNSLGQRRAFAQHWANEPRISRMDDGSSDWVHRVRLLGNGVVPQQAAIAWDVLAERLKNPHFQKRNER